MVKQGNMEDLISIIKDFHSNQGIRLTGIKIDSAGNWSAETASKKSGMTINEFFEILKEAEFKSKTRIGHTERLRGNIKDYFGMQSKLKGDTKFVNIEVENKMTNGDASILREITHVEFRKIKGAGKLNWKFFQEMLEIYLK